LTNDATEYTVALFFCALKLIEFNAT